MLNVPLVGLFAVRKLLLSVSALRGPVIRRHLLNGQIDQDEAWAQGVSACDLIFRNILLKEKSKLQGLAKFASIKMFK